MTTPANMPGPARLLGEQSSPPEILLCLACRIHTDDGPRRAATRLLRHQGDLRTLTRRSQLRHPDQRQAVGMSLGRPHRYDTCRARRDGAPRCCILAVASWSRIWSGPVKGVHPCLGERLRCKHHLPLVVMRWPHNYRSSASARRNDEPHASQA